jgi:hypothetical protein
MYKGSVLVRVRVMGLSNLGRRVTICVTGGRDGTVDPACRGPGTEFRRLARLACALGHGAQGRHRRPPGGGRRVADEGRPAPLGPWLEREPGRPRARPPLLPLRGRVEPSEAVPGGAGMALPVVPRREPGRCGAAPRARRPYHRGDWARPATTPCSPLPAMPHDVVSPERGALYRGRPRGPSRLSRLPPAQRSIAGIARILARR